MSKKKKKSDISQPLVKMRHIATVLVVLVVVLTGPLLLVWKQAYINTASLKLDSMADTLSVLNREIATMRLQCEHLSSNSRIETIAREKLSLEYPSSSQIVIVSIGTGSGGVFYSVRNIFAKLIDSISGERI